MCIFFGCLDYLIENNLMDKDFKNIKYIVAASFLFILTILLLDYDYEYIKEEIFNFD